MGVKKYMLCALYHSSIYLYISEWCVLESRRVISSCFWEGDAFVESGGEIRMQRYRRRKEGRRNRGECGETNKNTTIKKVISTSVLCLNSIARWRGALAVLEIYTTRTVRLLLWRKGWSETVIEEVEMRKGKWYIHWCCWCENLDGLCECIWQW